MTNNIDRVMEFLDANIADSERKLFTKLVIHVKKRNTRSLNMLASNYNIDTKKFMFPPNSEIDNVYLNRLEELILYCRKIINEKIDISSFRVERFHIKKQLDLSNLNKVSELLRQLRTFNMRHAQMTVSKELIEAPLLILTLDAKKHLDIEAIEKHTYDYLNNYALVEDDGRAIPSHSILDEVKRDYIVSSSAAQDFKPALVREAILDYYNTSGEVYYISADVEEKVSNHVHAMIKRKSSTSAKKSNYTYFILELLVPLIALGLSLVCLLIGATTNMDIDLLMYCLFAYSLFNIGLYIYRHGYVKEKKDEYCYTYYEQHPRQFLYFSLTILFSIIIQVTYMYLFSAEVSSGLSSLGNALKNWYYNDGAMTILSIVICGLIVGGVGVTLKFSKYHVCEIFTGLAGALLVIIFGVRSHLWQFASFRDYAIAFTAIGVSLMIYLLIHFKRGRIKNLVILSLFLIDFIIIIILNNQFYLRELFFNIKELF